MSNSIRGGAFLSILLVLMAAASFAQQSSQAPAKMGDAIGRATIDGTLFRTTGPIFVKDEVSTDTATHLSVITYGSTLVFTPNSNFVAKKNGYELKSGGSKVASYTGMTAHLPNCYSVTPVNPTLMTLYEVNWSGSSAFVYARSLDVKINYWMSGEPDSDTANARHPDRDWIVQEGHTARIRDVKLCKPLLDFWPNSNIPTALELAGTTAVVVTEPWWTKQKMSADTP